MSKKQNTASALANILSARREPEPSAEPDAPEPSSVAPEPVAPPSPAPLVLAAPPKGRGGKSSDPEFKQCSVYLPKKLRKQINRALEDEDKGRDFSGLVKDLLEQWLVSGT